MPNLYRQLAGAWTMPDGHSFTGLYSGGGPNGLAEYRNQPSQEGVFGLGPLPTGTYAIGEALERGPGHTGSFVLPLMPDAETRAKIIALGRGPDSFFCHGDNVLMNHSVMVQFETAVFAGRVAFGSLFSNSPMISSTLQM